METGRHSALSRMAGGRATLVACCRGLRGESGSALIELALVVGLLGAPLLLGTAEMGSLVYDSMEISDAASVAALYGMQSASFAADSAGMTSAARADAADFGANLSVTPTSYYVCALAVGGTQYTGSNALTTATANCSGSGNHVLQFVQVTTSVSVAPLFHCPGLPNTFILGGSSVMEVEQ